MKIGLEVHIALPTKSKLFCACSTEAEVPNTSVCPICMGFPGSKPALNEAAVESALGIANALHCSINKSISFVRKVYFYPDLPKCYQITQTDGAIGSEGYLDIGKKVRIRRVQIEEDPAQIVRKGLLTLLDFNRCGTPLVEIVTEPDITIEGELRSFIASLRSILYYLGVDINKEIKADLNISVAEVRVEVKNVTGIKSLVEALRFEVERQNSIVKAGGSIARETRGYNEKRKVTESLREKETDEEYGYIYEPDLTVFDISGMKCEEPVYIDRVAEGLAKGSDISPRTIREMTMLDRHTLELIKRFRGKYKMRSIIHAIQRFKKYNEEDPSSEVIEKMASLIEADKILTKEAINDIKSGIGVSVEYAKMGDADIDKVIMEFLRENPHLVSEYKRRSKTMNLMIDRIAKIHGLHPKDVARRLALIIGRNK